LDYLTTHTSLSPIQKGWRWININEYRDFFGGVNLYKGKSFTCARKILFKKIEV
jgi:hypothetical protein